MDGDVYIRSVMAKVIEFTTVKVVIGSRREMMMLRCWLNSKVVC